MRRNDGELEGGLGAQCSVGDRGATVGAEGCGGIDDAIAGIAPCGYGGGRHRPIPRVWRDCRGGEDLIGDVDGLSGVVLTDAAGHEEALDEAEDGGDSGPEEDEVKDAEAVAAEVEVMDAEAAEEEREEDADGLVLAGSLVFCVEPGALVLGHVGGVDGIGRVHGVLPLEWFRKIYARGRMIVPTSGNATLSVAFSECLRPDRSQFTRVLMRRRVAQLQLYGQRYVGIVSQINETRRALCRQFITGSVDFAITLASITRRTLYW
jgi:hypothetical protein